MRFVAPSALPSRRVYFPEPDPEPACGQSRHCPLTCRPKATHQRAETPSDHFATHCPTADESVVVMGDSAVREATVHEWTAIGLRRVGRPACGHPDKRGIVGSPCNRVRSGTEVPSVARSQYGGHRYPTASGSSRGLPAAGPGRSPEGASLLCCHRIPLRGRTKDGRPSVVRRFLHSPYRAEARCGRLRRPVLDRPRLPSEEENRGARPEWAWFLVASFQARFAPPTPFFTTLTVFPSPRPSGMFHPVTLVGFGFRQRYPPARFPTRPARGPFETVCLPRSPPLRWKCGPPRRANVHFLPGEPGARCVLFRGLTPPRWSGPLPSAFTPDQVSRARARRDRCSLPGSR